MLSPPDLCTSIHCLCCNTIPPTLYTVNFLISCQWSLKRHCLREAHLPIPLKVWPHSNPLGPPHSATASLFSQHLPPPNVSCNFHKCNFHKCIMLKVYLSPLARKSFVIFCSLMKLKSLAQSLAYNKWMNLDAKDCWSLFFLSTLACMTKRGKKDILNRHLWPAAWSTVSFPWAGISYSHSFQLPRETSVSIYV